MRWTTTDAERAVAELQLELRVAGIGPLLHQLVALGDIALTTVWCPGMVDGRGAVLIAGPRRLHVVRAHTPASSHASAPGAVQTTVANWQLSDISTIEADEGAGRIRLRAGSGPDVVVERVPRAMCRSFVSQISKPQPGEST